MTRRRRSCGRRDHDDGDPDHAAHQPASTARIAAGERDQGDAQSRERGRAPRARSPTAWPTRRRRRCCTVACAHCRPLASSTSRPPPPHAMTAPAGDRRAIMPLPVGARPPRRARSAPRPPCSATRCPRSAGRSRRRSRRRPGRRRAPSRITAVRIAIAVSRSPADVDVADHAAVQAAAGRLERLDDLHRAHLRRAGQRAGREAGATARRSAVAPVGDVADDGRHDVHHVARSARPPSGRRPRRCPARTPGRGRCGRGRRA